MTFKTVCAWCGVLMSGVPDADQTSHGTCTYCYIRCTEPPEVVATVWGVFTTGAGL